MVMHMRRTAIRHAAAMALAMGVLVRADGAGPPLEIVDPGVGDVSGAAYPMRQFSVELSPHGFERTYRVPGRNDLLMRTDGALYAVFDESHYKRNPKYKKVVVYHHVVPAGTTFYIGEPNFKKIRSTGIRAVNLRVTDQYVQRAPSNSMKEVAGVKMLGEDGHADHKELGPSQYVDRRIVGGPPGPIHQVNEDISYPRVQRRPKPVAPAQDDAATRAGTPASPEVQARIDQLMRRASKDS